MGSAAGSVQLGAVCLVAVSSFNRAGRVYAAYGGVYVSVAILWLWGVDGIRPHLWNLVGVTVTLVGMGIIMFAPK